MRALLAQIASRDTRNDEGLGGDFGLAQAVSTIASAAIQAGGQVGAAAITADANKYAIRTQAKTTLLDTLAQERVALATEEGETTRAQIQANATNQGVSTGAIALVLLALLLWR